MSKMLTAAFCLMAPAAAQQAGTVMQEESPAISLQHCTLAAGCQKEDASLVLDASWRWVHNTGGYENCYDENGWHPGHCPDPATCKHNCAVEGIDSDGYASTYGVHQEPTGVKLDFMTDGGNVGSRLYVTDGADSYKMFKLLNQEFTIEVDTSTLYCGMNGAAYFIEMDAKGGHGQDGNAAGAKFGTGYCDAQCPHEKFDHDEQHGVCCVEMDIWEANREAAAYTPHPCSTVGPTKCQGIDCGYVVPGTNSTGDERWKGLCDKDGCDFNNYRMGAYDFYGPGKAVDSAKSLTVVTQFITDDQTDTGNLVEIRRIYVQDGEIIANADSKVQDVTGNTMTDEFCNAQKKAFSDYDHHQEKGGLRSMGEALKRGMVLSLSVWDDYATEMGWLDAHFPKIKGISEPGVLRGPCDGTTSHPKYVRTHHPDSYVKYSNIKYGQINSTFSAARRLDVHI